MQGTIAWASGAAAGGTAHEHRRRLAAFDAARRHSSLVRRLRLLLPLAGVTTLVAFVGAARIAVPEGLDLSVARTTVTRNAIIMEQPKLSGFDKASREYTVTAERATQLLSTPDEVRLEAIRAEIRLAGQGSATVTAAAGDYDNGKATLKLHGGIGLVSSDGYSLAMTDADIDLKGGTLVSANPVRVVYQDSETRGDRLSVREGGGIIVLESGVRTMLMPPKRKPAAAPTAAADKEDRASR